MWLNETKRMALINCKRSIRIDTIVVFFCIQQQLICNMLKIFKSISKTLLHHTEFFFEQQPGFYDSHMNSNSIFKIGSNIYFLSVSFQNMDYELYSCIRYYGRVQPYTNSVLAKISFHVLLPFNSTKELAVNFPEGNMSNSFSFLLIKKIRVPIYN